MKLTLVSITFRGRTVSRFVQLASFNGKSVAPRSLIASILDELGVNPGDTFTMG